MKRLALLALATGLIGMAAANAQQAPPPTQPTQPVQPINPHGGNNTYYGGGGGWGTYHHASTAAEGQLRGMSDLVRSTSQANLNNSAAAINYTVAQRSAMENRQQWTNTYFQMRQANRAYRAAEAGPPPTMEDLVRYAQAGKPKPLSPGEVDPVSGGINWPLLLQEDSMADQRKEVEDLFAQRASQSVLKLDAYNKLKAVTDQMLAELSTKIKDVPAYQYIQAKEFIKSLAYAGTLPAS